MPKTFMFDLRGGRRAGVLSWVKFAGLLGVGHVEGSAANFLAVEFFESFLGVRLFGVVDERVKALGTRTWRVGSGQEGFWASHQLL